MINDFVVLSKKETKALQKMQLDMFVEFINICKCLKLRYYLIGGTALGAVRHGGFIPWDDDIDVGMPRKDYEIFLEKAPLIISNNLFIQSYISDPLYPNNFAKIRNENTTYIERAVKHLNIHHGIYIDIFPLDGVRTSIISKLKNRIYSKKIREAFDLHQNIKDHGIKSWFLKKAMEVLLFNYTLAEIIAKRDNLYKKYDYDKCDIIANFCGAWGEKEIVPKSFFGEGSKKKFENIDVLVPEKYDNYLTQLYGDYMKLPPIEKRITHHYCIKIDLNQSYKNYFIEK